MRNLTPSDQRAVQAARHRCALFGRDDWLAVEVQGPDTRKFLHNMLTQEVKALPDLAVRDACLCDAQGAMLAVTRLVMDGERAILWTDLQNAQGLADQLDKYVIMDDVQVHVQEELALLVIVGPQAENCLQAAHLPAPQALGQAVAATMDTHNVLIWRQDLDGRPDAPHGPGQPAFWLQVARAQFGDLASQLLAAGAQAGTHGGLELLRVRAGIPRLQLDLEPGTLPLEAGLKAAIDYRKGCYLGQEAIAIMTYRGQARRHLCWLQPLDGDLPAPGTQLRTQDGKRAGKLGSAVADGEERWALGTVQRKAYTPGGIVVATAEDGQSARLRIIATTEAGVFVEPAAT